ncbi:MAG: helix-turn-helix domain-containing protein [Chloroflexi bacterium]|nr:MAG: helix-turn-helix domain-containing protein [Chloroflexota bacterium]
MDELGHILREARETKGFTLTQVQEITRINTKYLEALETGNYHILPTPVHARGFLRNYARFLGLDPQPLLERLNTKLENLKQPASPTNTGETPAPILPAPPQQESIFFDPVNYEISSGAQRSPELTLRLFMILSMLIFLFLVGSKFLPILTGNDSQPITEGVTNTLQNILGNEPTVTPEPTLDINATLTFTEIITPTTRNNAPTTITPAPVPTRPRLPATMETINLRLEITERTFMEVTIDGNTVFSGIARRGDTFEWVAEEEAKLLTGNAIGILVTINDIPLGRFGERGENKEEVWRTTN